MAASVLFACGLNEQKLPSYVHISEESNVDGSFLISSILGQRLRISNAGTVLVCLQQNYQHYFHAGMRLGYNANIFYEKTLHVVDPLTEIARNDITKWMEDERKLSTNLLDDIRAHIKASIRQRISTTVLIDNLAILLNLGATKEEVILFCYDLAELSKQYENLTVITKLNNCDLYEPLDNNVAKLGTLRIRASQLKSGMSRDVDGKLVIEREIISEQIVQEKLNQKTIQLLEKKETEKKYENINSELKQIATTDETKANEVQKNESLTVSNQLNEMGESEGGQEEKENDSNTVNEKLPTPKEEQKETEQESEREHVKKEEKHIKEQLKPEKMDTTQQGYILEVVRKEVLYKVNDRSIKILSPGEVGVRV